MGIFKEICMTIDIVNNENKNDTKLFHTFKANNRKKRLFKIINNFFFRDYNINVDLIVEFLETYITSLNSINFDDILSVYKDEENINLIANFKPSKITKGINITFSYDYMDKTNNATIKVHNTNNNSIRNVPNIYNLNEYKSDEIKQINELNFVIEYIRSIMIKYLLERLNIGD